MLSPKFSISLFPSLTQRKEGSLSSPQDFTEANKPNFTSALILTIMTKLHRNLFLSLRSDYSWLKISKVWGFDSLIRFYSEYWANEQSKLLFCYFQLYYECTHTHTRKWKTTKLFLLSQKCKKQEETSRFHPSRHLAASHIWHWMSGPKQKHNLMVVKSLSLHQSLSSLKTGIKQTYC